MHWHTRCRSEGEIDEGVSLVMVSMMLRDWGFDPDDKVVGAIEPNMVRGSRRWEQIGWRWSFIFPENEAHAATINLAMDFGQELDAALTRITREKWRTIKAAKLGKPRDGAKFWQAQAMAGVV